MMLVEVGADKVRSGRKVAGRGAGQGRTVRAIANKVVATNDGPMNRRPGQVGCSANGMNHMPVTFWGPEGNCYEGMSPHIDITGEVIFVESKHLVPVGTEVTIRFTPPNDVLVNWGVRKGTVVWHCLSSDHFKNLKGFGVFLKGHQPQTPEPTGSDGPKEAA